MFHLFKHADKKFDVAFVVKGKYIMGSNQHYSNREDAINAILLVLKDAGSRSVMFQDDTPTQPVILFVSAEGKVLTETSVGVKKKYIPRKK